MTDDEIDAAAKRVYDLGYRAGMRRAAQIAREQEYTLWGAEAGGFAAAIERAASDEASA